jgi:alkylation response protein AidB-like acyl-CoA dehydrogenase
MLLVAHSFMLITHSPALSYAKNRLAMRSLTGAKHPDKVCRPMCKRSHAAPTPSILTESCISLAAPDTHAQPADPIIEQPDVRRMLLTAKAFAEGGRCMTYHTAMLADHMIATESAEERRKHDDYLGLFTPILKGFLTEVSLEAAKDGIQVRTLCVCMYVCMCVCVCEPCALLAPFLLRF